MWRFGKRELLIFLILLGLPCCSGNVKPIVRVTYYSPYPLAFYNAFWEQRIPDVTFKLTNPSDMPITVRIISEYVGISYKAVTTVTIPPRKTVKINQTIPLILDKIKEIKSETKIPLHYVVECRRNDRWDVICEQTEMVEVYPINVMVWALKLGNGRMKNMQDYIAVFVTPNSEEVQELLAKAKMFAPKHELKGVEGNVLPQVEAIFDALKFEYNVSYVNTPFLYGRDYVQRVRFPSESLKLKAINCVDGAVLFASALEALGIRTFIILLPDHALVAWEDPKNGLMYALETTMINSSFSSALNEGLRELNENWKNLTDDNPWNGYIVDIEACRKAGIVPLPLY